MATLKNTTKKCLAWLLVSAMLATLPVYADSETSETTSTPADTMEVTAEALSSAETTTEAATSAEETSATEASSDDGSGSSINEDVMSTGDRENTYANYLRKYADAAHPDSEIVIEAAKYTSTEADASGVKPELSQTSYQGVDNCLLWSNQSGVVNYSFTVKESGLYNLELLYYTIAGDNTTVELSMKIDGDFPFTAAKDFTLDRYWADASGVKKDSRDNDIRSGQVEYDTWVTYPIKDKEGLFNDPYFFYLEAGNHTLTFTGIKVNVAFKSFTFKNYDAVSDYTKPTDEQLQTTPALTSMNAIGSTTVFVEGENNLYKSASTLYATSDRTTYMTSPSHPTKQRYNTVGATTWNKATQSITWEIVIPNDGYYTFNFKARQNIMRGFFSNRRIYIDGVVPNTYFDDVKFPYSSNWYTQSILDESGDNVYINLTAGKHTITMEAIPGTIGESMQRLDEIVYQLNYYYRRILMITGPEPDEFNDYNVDIQIPELVPTFEELIKQLEAEKNTIEQLGQGSQASTLVSMQVILQRCVDEPMDIPVMASTLKDYISALSAWMRDYRDQPLELDYIEVATVHEALSTGQGNFFGDLAFGFSAFIGSFFEDYTSISSASATSLNVWVALGRDQATVIDQLVTSSFNTTHDGISAKISLVQGGILEATMAGKGPEIALFIGGDTPIQLAARDLLVDLTRFPDYEEIYGSRYTDTLSTLYTYNGGVYGLPISQSFPMMFYRSDILEELGIDTPPQTWTELIEVISVLQRTYLDAGLVQPTSNLSSSVFDAGDTFILLMLQNGQKIYNDDFSATTFDSEASIKAFTEWTEFYTVRSLDQTYDAFTRFRTGEMPLLIQNYTFYNQLSVAAPEIKGLWNFTLVPGTEQADGTINHATNSATAGAIIFNKVSNVEAAWEFVKWFTSTEVQVEYGRTIEALLGPMGRFDTANIEALESLPWSTSEYEKISAQMSQTVEVPIIPASYATTRHIKNAFRSVVNSGDNPRYALSAYNREINAEIERKNNDLKSFEE